MAESEWEVSVRNHKDSIAEVEMFEPVGGDWEILSSSHTPIELDSHTFKFVVDVPARDEVKVTYRLRVRWC